MFKVGQKVICKDASGNVSLIKNKIYVVEWTGVCHGCGVSEISIIDEGKAIGTRCTICSEVTIGRLKYKSKRFSPLSTKYEIISNMEIIKEIITERSDIPIKEPVF